MFVNERDLENAVRIAKLEMDANIQYVILRTEREVEAVSARLEAMEKEFDHKLELLAQKIESIR